MTATTALCERFGCAPRVGETHLLHDADPYAANTLDDRERVRSREATDAVGDGDLLTLTLPAGAWVAMSVEYR